MIKKISIEQQNKKTAKSQNFKSRFNCIKEFTDQIKTQKPVEVLRKFYET